MASLDDIKQLVLDIKDELAALPAKLQINPKQIVATALADIAKNMGLIQAGEFRVGNSVEPGLGFTGGRFGYPGFLYGSDTWFIAGVENDVLKTGMSIVNGKLYAEEATISGTLTASAGAIGGWSIGAAAIQKLSSAKGIILDSSAPQIEVGDTGSVHIVLDGANERIRSSNYSSGVAGFNIDAKTGDAEFNNLTARGLIKTAVFQKDVISSVGGSLLVLDSDALDADMSAADSETVTIKGTTTFAIGNILRIKDSTDDEWLEITSIASAPTYSVNRDKAGAYGSNANPTWKKGQAVVNYGSSGDGGLILTGGATPKLSLFTHLGQPWTTLLEQVNMTAGQFVSGAGAVVHDEDGMKIPQIGDGILWDESSTSTHGSIAMHVFDEAAYSVLRMLVYQPVGSNLLTNGDFEAGDFTGWTEHDPSGDVSVVSGQGWHNSYAAKFLSTAFANGAYITQTVSAFNVGLVKLRAKAPNGIALLTFESGLAGTIEIKVPQSSEYITLIIPLPYSSANRTDLKISSTGSNDVYLDEVELYLSANNQVNLGGDGATLSSTSIAKISVSDDAAYVKLVTSILGGGTHTSTIYILAQDVIYLDGSKVVINNNAIDADTQIKGDTDANLIYVDASTDRVGIGTATPGYKLDVNGDVNVASGKAFKINGTNLAAADVGAQPSDAELTAIAGLTSAADKVPRFTGSGTADLLDVKAGTWTPNAAPTGTTRTNITAVTAHAMNYIRVGNQVMFNGLVEIQTTATGAFACFLSLPIASNFSSADDANGNGTQPGSGTPNIISIREDQTNDCLRLDGYSNSTSNLFYRLAGGYIIK